MAFNSCNCLNNSYTLAGMSLDCAANIGGIKQVFIALYDPEMFKLDSSGATVTGFTSASGTAFYQYCLKKNLSSYEQTLTVEDNGNRYITNALTLVFPRMDSQKRLEVQALAYADVCAVVEDRNGIFWALGIEEPLTSTDGSGVTGTQKSDANQYTVVLGNDEPAYAYPLSSDAVSALEALVAND